MKTKTEAKIGMFAVINKHYYTKTPNASKYTDARQRTNHINFDDLYSLEKIRKHHVQPSRRCRLREFVIRTATDFEHGIPSRRNRTQGWCIGYII